MHALNLPVEDSPGAKYIGNRRVHRWAKLPRPLPFRVRLAKHVLFDGLVLADAFQLLRARFGISFGNCYRNAGVSRRLDADLFGKRNFTAPGGGPLQLEIVATRMRLQADASDSEPHLAGRVVAEEHLVFEPFP